MRGFVGWGVAAATLSLGLISIAGGLEAARAADMPVKAPVVVAARRRRLGPVFIGLGVGFRSTQANATVTSVRLLGFDRFATTAPRWRDRRVRCRRTIERYGFPDQSLFWCELAVCAAMGRGNRGRLGIRRQDHDAQRHVLSGERLHHRTRGRRLQRQVDLGRKRARPPGLTGRSVDTVLRHAGASWLHVE